MKVLGIVGMFMFLGTAQAGFFGTDLECHGDDGEVLTINHSPTRTQHIYVDAVLKKDETTQKFFGTTNQRQNIYLMNDSNGEKVLLTVKNVFDHGGRCGRCAPSNDIETYAKLTIGLEEKNFTCNSL